MPDALLDWLDRRTGWRGLVASQLTGYRVDARLHSWLTLGGLLLFILGLQIATGILLLFHYQADPASAFESVRHIRREVPFGWLVQTVHGHGANLMVMVVFVHLLREAWLGAYKSPRELNWLTGCVLLVLTLGAGLTGYILPWSQVSYWATTVVTSAMESTPFVGHELMRAVRGGETVGPATFRRAFAAHVALIPLGMLAIAGVHLYLLRLHGSAPYPRRRGEPDGPTATRPFFPDFVLHDALLFVGFLVVLMALVAFAPHAFSAPQAFEPADPLDTPPGVKPEWYFLWSYGLLRLMPEVAALGLQGVLFGLVFALPFLDRSPHRHPADRPWVMACIAGVVAAFVALTIYGARV